MIVKEALANGRVLEDDAALAPIAAAAERHGTTRDAIALAAVLAQPWAGVVLSGAATPEQLRSNATAVDVALEPGEVEALLALAEPAEAYWEARSARAWA